MGTLQVILKTLLLSYVSMFNSILKNDSGCVSCLIVFLRMTVDMFFVQYGVQLKGAVKKSNYYYYF